MELIRLSLLEVNIAASTLIMVTAIIRALGLYRLPKKLFSLLWGVAALRLLIPLSLSFPILPSSAPAPVPQTGTAAPYVEAPVTGGGQVVQGTIAPASEPFPLEAVWLVGAAVVAVFFIALYLRFRRELKNAALCENEAAKRYLAEHPLRRKVEIRQSGRITAALTYGVLRPVILLSQQTDWRDEDSLIYVLTHEYVHIRRFDALGKLALAAVVCIHWFNPLVWVMYALAGRDMELSCDEAVLEQLGLEKKSDYSNMLIGLAEAKTRMAFPSYFGKNAVEERITAVMKMKKYGQPLIFLALSCVLLLGAVAAVNLTERAEYELLFSGLSAEDAETITALLEEQGVEYRLEDGGTIYVPEEQAVKLKAQILMQRYPKDGYTEVVYWEDDPSMSEGDREAAFLISLQNELAEIIRMYEGVEDARVMIDKANEAVSVVVVMADGQELSREQVAAIHKYISNAVPEGIRYISITTSDGNIVEAPGSTAAQEEETELAAQLRDALAQYEGVKDVEIAFTDDGKWKAVVAAMPETDTQSGEWFQDIQELYYGIVPLEKAGGISISQEVSNLLIRDTEDGELTLHAVGQSTEKVEQLTRALKAIEGVSDANFTYYESEDGALRVLNVNLMVPDQNTQQGTDVVRVAAQEIFPEIKPEDVVVNYLPAGEIGSVTYPAYEVVPGGAAVGVEGHTDILEYVEEDLSQEQVLYDSQWVETTITGPNGGPQPPVWEDGSDALEYILGSEIRDFDAGYTENAPSWINRDDAEYVEGALAPAGNGGAAGVDDSSELDGYVEEYLIPIQLVSGFDQYYSQNYTLIDEASFSLTTDNPAATYAGESEKDVVVSFEDNGPVTCFVTIEGGANAGTYKCGFSGEGAIRIDLEDSTSYKMEYQLGIKEDPDPTVSTDETVDASSGTIKIYEAK